LICGGGNAAFVESNARCNLANCRILLGILKCNLESVEKPANYEKLRQKLSTIKPNRRAPSVKEGPENADEISSLDKFLARRFSTSHRPVDVS
jgi:hypothetical protein